MAVTFLPHKCLRLCSAQPLWPSLQPPWLLVNFLSSNQAVQAEPLITYHHLLLIHQTLSHSIWPVVLATYGNHPHRLSPQTPPPPLTRIYLYLPISTPTSNPQILPLLPTPLNSWPPTPTLTPMSQPSQSPARSTPTTACAGVPGTVKPFLTPVQGPKLCLCRQCPLSTLMA